MTSIRYLTSLQRTGLAIMSMLVGSASLHIQTASAAPVKIATVEPRVEHTYQIPPKIEEVIPTSTVTPVVNAATDTQAIVDVIRTLHVTVTAYSSTIAQCDGSPFITADGSVVEDGIVATNLLPFGTQIRIPAHFGDRIFTVHDRMNARYSQRIDIWMSDKKATRAWGVKRNVNIEVIKMGDGKKNWDQWKGRTAELHRIGKYGLATHSPLF